MFDFIHNPLFWKYASIPVVAAFVGWSTNWIAIKFTFIPLEYVGFFKPWLGWQGIIPSKARKMAVIGVDSTLERLGSLSEVFEQMNPDKIAKQIIKVIEPRLEELTDEIVSQDNKVLWENLPLSIKKQFYLRVKKQLPKLVDNLVYDVGANIEDLIHLKHMVTEQLVRDKGLLNRIFMECGADEFRFIIRSGFYFGALFGIIQMGIWYYYQAWWILPLFGLLNGLATNWIALNVIFRPVNPFKIGPWQMHGLFLRRQKEVSEVYTRIITREVITMKHIVMELLHGPRSARSHAMIKRHLKPIVDETVGMARLAVQSALGAKRFADIKEYVGQTSIDLGAEPFQDELFNMDRADVVQKLMQERMEELTSDEFSMLLRPCFQEDEWKLVLLGAVLGLMAGIFQLVFIFEGV